MIIDDNLKPSKQVANAVGKAQAALSILKQTVVSQDKSIFLPLYKQLVRPHLEYDTCAWKLYLKCNVESIEKVQRHATKCINSMNNLSFEQRLSSLQLESLSSSRDMNDLIMVFKFVKNFPALYSKCFFTYNSNCTRGHKYKLYKPSVKTDCHKFSFSDRAIDLWNNLPPNIVECTTLECFKKSLKKFYGLSLN